MFGYSGLNSRILLSFLEKKRIHYLCNDQDLIILLKEATYDSAKAMSDPTTKDRDRNAQIKQIEKICMSVRNSVRNRAGQDKSTVVGHIPGEFAGSFSKWFSRINPNDIKMTQVDVSNGFADLICVKDIFECGNMKMAGAVISDVMDTFVPRNLKNIVTAHDQSISHSMLPELIENAILDQAQKLQKIKVKINKLNMVGVGVPLSPTETILQHIKPEKVRSCCLPVIIQSKDETHLSPGIENVVSCCAVSSYGSYCSFLARTYLFDPNQRQLHAYGFLLKAQEEAIAALQPGRRIRDAYNSAMDVVVKEDIFGFVKYMENTFGMGIGIESSERYLKLNGTNEVILRTKMVFRVAVNLKNVPLMNEKVFFSMVLGDTIIVPEKGEVPRVVTSLSQKTIEKVVFRSKEESETGNQELEEHARKKLKLGDVFAISGEHGENQMQP
ncbi:FACT complex subunit SPT16-like isoform X2 [Papaver somniferum]|uniref:FACT complex subunit SPT16-like isoform X2 n=1 Tax=Papaver somniferum TaxID=3469 RepID=UPI000E6F84D8|nr:FACT complex subunit SPT16-like isoform X2 [Papaver somniferum]